MNPIVRENNKKNQQINKKSRFYHSKSQISDSRKDYKE